MPRQPRGDGDSELIFEGGEVVLQIVVNGESREVSAGISIAALLQELGLDPRFLAVERNLQVVSRTEHSVTLLVEGDRIEIVTLVGGG